MSKGVNRSLVQRWRADPTQFIERVLHDPETGAPFKLLDAERAFLAHAFQTNSDGKLLYPEQIYACPKKSGKTGFAAMHMLTMILLFGERFAEGYALANDLEQAQSRVFQAIKRIVEASPLLKREAKITADKIVFPAFHNATISAVANDYAGAAGANPTISSFDELWAYISESSRRLWDEMVPPPTRKIACRLTVTYAGFSGESDLLEELYKRGLAQPQIGPNLYAGDGLLMFWSHEPIAPWQTEAWLADMRRSLRPNQFLRMIENRFVASESSFVDLAHWDACVNPQMSPLLVSKELPIWVGVDASVKHDSTAIVACTWVNQRVQLVAHRIFQPSPDDPLDFENTIEATLLDLKARFAVRKVLFDPWQMQSVAQRLTKQNLRDRGISAERAEFDHGVAKSFRADRGQKPRALPRCRHASGGQPRCRCREHPRLAHHQRKSIAQDRRGCRPGDGRARHHQRRDGVRGRSAALFARRLQQKPRLVERRRRGADL